MIREKDGNLLFDFFAVAFKSAKVLVNAVMNAPPLALPLLEAGKARDSFDLDPAISVYCELVHAPAKQPHVRKQQREAFRRRLFYPRLFVEIQGSGFLVWSDRKFPKSVVGLLENCQSWPARMPHLQKTHFFGGFCIFCTAK